MSLESPLVTIGIPSYQCGPFIREAVASALSQDFTDLEVLVVDDASTDDTLEVLAEFDDPRLRILRNATNIGPGPNWNRVLDEARGRYVKVMGCDDALLPGSVGAQVAPMEADPDIALVAGPRLLVTEGGRRIMRRGNGHLSGRVSGAEAGREMVRHGSHLVGEPCATLMRMSAVRHAGAFDESEPYCIDMDMWIRLLEVGDLFIVDKPVCKYRIVESSWSISVATTQFDDVATLLRSVAARGAFGVTAEDLAVGLKNAKRLAFGRRVVYRVLFDRELHTRVRYVLIGVWNTIFGFLSFAAALFLLGDRLRLVALVISYVLSILNAFVGQRTVVFRSRGKVLHELVRFATVYVVALGVNAAALQWLTGTLHQNTLLSQAAITLVLIVPTYVINKRFSFKQGAE